MRIFEKAGVSDIIFKTLNVESLPSVAGSEVNVEN